MPHLIPSDAATGLKEDILLYENATIWAGSPANSGADAGKTAFLQVGEMVKVGDTWKFVDLPRVIDPTKNAAIAAIEGGIRSAIYRSEPGEGPGGFDNPMIAEAVKALSAYDSANAALLAKGDPRELARFHVGRIAPLRDVVKAAQAAGDARIELDHNKLIVDSLSAAYASARTPTGPGSSRRSRTRGARSARMPGTSRSRPTSRFRTSSRASTTSRLRKSGSTGSRSSSRSLARATRPRRRSCSWPAPTR